MTKGESRVNFNTSGSGVVDTIKKATAAIIDDCETMKSPATDAEHIRLISLAQTAYEEGGMWAVKAATYVKEG